MLIFQDFFKDFEGFKETFGLRECGNGVFARQNKIFLKCLKDIKFVSEMRKYSYIPDSVVSDSYSLSLKRSIARNFFEIKNMNDLTSWIKKYLSCKYFMINSERFNIIELAGWKFFHNDFRLDNAMGVCVDGTINYIRYVHSYDERHIVKKKAGRFLDACINLYEHIPESLRIFAEEEFSADWSAFVVEQNNNDYELVVDDDFKSIYSYDKCGGNMGSCMGHEYGSQSKFYKISVNAKAASLRNSNGTILARCVLWSEVFDNEERVYRLAERQYAENGSNILKRQLVSALIKGGYIDGYKNIGVSCHDNTAFVGNDGRDLSSKRFYVKCLLEDGDTLSYQDSFIYYDMESNRAYNHSDAQYQYTLDTTNSRFGCSREEEYSEYHDCYIDAEDAVWCESRQSYMYANECIPIDGEWYFEEDCCKCDYCDEYYYEDDGYYSDLTDETYCCEDCRDIAEKEYKERNWYYSELTKKYYETTSEKEEAEEDYKKYNWYYSDWDDCYVEDVDDLHVFFSFNFYMHVYEKKYILASSIPSELSDGTLIYYLGNYYDNWDINKKPIV